MTASTKLKHLSLRSAGLFLGTLMLVVISSQPTFAAIEAVQFEDPTTLSRYQDLIAELRCLVCQNQNLADSDADLAKDLRRKTAEMLKQGKTDQQILDYMSDRYGDFVLYRPPFRLSTALIWVGPFILLIVAATALLFNIRRRQQNESIRAADSMAQDQRSKLRDIMNNSPDLSDSGDQPER